MTGYFITLDHIRRDALHLADGGMKFTRLHRYSHNSQSNSHNSKMPIQHRGINTESKMCDIRHK